MNARCNYCKTNFETTVHRINKSKKRGHNIYCGTVCSNLAKVKTLDEKFSVIKCNYCKKDFRIKNNLLNSNKKKGFNCYCGKDCQSKSRAKSTEDKKKIKKIYDSKYRKENKDKIKTDKQKYYHKIKINNPIKFKEIRIKKNKYQKEYIKQPKYKNWKKEYDEKHLAKSKYGDFWESSILLNKIKLNKNK